MRIQESFAVLQESSLPTRWMRTYLFAYFIVFFIRTGLDTLLLLQNFVLSGYDPALLAVLLFLALLCMGSGIAAFLPMKKLLAAGYHWNVLHMGCTALYYAARSAITVVDTGADLSLGYFGSLLIFLAIYLSAWFWPNYIYFKKRKELFRAYTQEEISYAKSRWHSLERA